MNDPEKNAQALARATYNGNLARAFAKALGITPEEAYSSLTKGENGYRSLPAGYIQLADGTIEIADLGGAGEGIEQSGLRRRLRSLID